MKTDAGKAARVALIKIIIVAMCFLPDGSDIARVMVDQGFAVDWPRYSKGYYR